MIIPKKWQYSWYARLWIYKVRLSHFYLVIGKEVFFFKQSNYLFDLMKIRIHEIFIDIFWYGLSFWNNVVISFEGYIVCSLVFVLSMWYFPQTWKVWILTTSMLGLNTCKWWSTCSAKWLWECLVNLTLFRTCLHYPNFQSIKRKKINR